MQKDLDQKTFNFVGLSTIVVGVSGSTINAAQILRVAQ